MTTFLAQDGGFARDPSYFPLSGDSQHAMDMFLFLVYTSTQRHNAIPPWLMVPNLRPHRIPGNFKLKDPRNILPTLIHPIQRHPKYPILYGPCDHNDMDDVFIIYALAVKRVDSEGNVRMEWFQELAVCRDEDMVKYLVQYMNTQLGDDTINLNPSLQTLRDIMESAIASNFVTLDDVHDGDTDNHEEPEVPRAVALNRLISDIAELEIQTDPDMRRDTLVRALEAKEVLEKKKMDAMVRRGRMMDSNQWVMVEQGLGFSYTANPHQPGNANQQQPHVQPIPQALLEMPIDQPGIEYVEEVDGQRVYVSLNDYYSIVTSQDAPPDQHVYPDIRALLGAHSNIYTCPIPYAGRAAHLKKDLSIQYVMDVDTVAIAFVLHEFLQRMTQVKIQPSPKGSSIAIPLRTSIMAVPLLITQWPPVPVGQQYIPQPPNGQTFTLLKYSLLTKEGKRARRGGQSDLGHTIRWGTEGNMILYFGIRIKETTKLDVENAFRIFMRAFSYQRPTSGLDMGGDPDLHWARAEGANMGGHCAPSGDCPLGPYSLGIRDSITPNSTPVIGNSSLKNVLMVLSKPAIVAHLASEIGDGVGEWLSRNSWIMRDFPYYTMVFGEEQFEKTPLESQPYKHEIPMVDNPEWNYGWDKEEAVNGAPSVVSALAMKCPWISHNLDKPMPNKSDVFIAISLGVELHDKEEIFLPRDTRYTYGGNFLNVSRMEPINTESRDLPTESVLHVVLQRRFNHPPFHTSLADKYGIMGGNRSMGDSFYSQAFTPEETLLHFQHGGGAGLFYPDEEWPDVGILGLSQDALHRARGMSKTLAFLACPGPGGFPVNLKGYDGYSAHKPHGPRGGVMVQPQDCQNLMWKLVSNMQKRTQQSMQMVQGALQKVLQKGKGIMENSSSQAAGFRIEITLMATHEAGASYIYHLQPELVEAHPTLRDTLTGLVADFKMRMFQVDIAQEFGYHHLEVEKLLLKDIMSQYETLVTLVANSYHPMNMDVLKDLSHFGICFNYFWDSKRERDHMLLSQLLVSQQRTMSNIGMPRLHDFIRDRLLASDHSLTAQVVRGMQFVTALQQVKNNANVTPGLLFSLVDFIMTQDYGAYQNGIPVTSEQTIALFSTILFKWLPVELLQRARMPLTHMELSFFVTQVMGNDGAPLPGVDQWLPTQVNVRNIKLITPKVNIWLIQLHHCLCFPNISIHVILGYWNTHQQPSQ